jgi:hypothetical protein
MMAPQTIEASLGHDCVGRVYFFAWQDRIAHSVEIQQNGSSQIWESVEGNDQQDWPPSPPFQNLSIQRIRESDVALLVGMAGKSHWSLSVDIDAERGSIRFDVACRITTDAGQLRSTYRCPSVAAVECLVVTGNASTIRQLENHWCVEPDSVDSSATVRWIYDFKFGAGPANK